jgi:hypothetical protein
MRRPLSIMTVALIALGCAVFSAVFCWAWASRCSAQVERHARELQSISLRHDQLEQIVYRVWSATADNGEIASQPRTALPLGAPAILPDGEVPARDEPESLAAQAPKSSGQATVERFQRLLADPSTL